MSPNDKEWASSMGKRHPSLIRRCVSSNYSYPASEMSKIWGMLSQNSTSQWLLEHRKRLNSLALSLKHLLKIKICLLRNMHLD